eukprot:3182420-Amphidinium_carterae.1
MVAFQPPPHSWEAMYPRCRDMQWESVFGRNNLCVWRCALRELQTLRQPTMPTATSSQRNSRNKEQTNINNSTKMGVFGTNAH